MSIPLCDNIIINYINENGQFYRQKRAIPRNEIYNNI